MIRRFARLLLAVVPALVVTHTAHADAVPLFDACPSAAHHAALSHELEVVQLSLAPQARATFEEARAAETLAALNVNLLLSLDADCTARIFDRQGHGYVVSAQPDVAAWAVRVAETLFALSPHAAPAEPNTQVPAEQHEPAAPQERAPPRLGALALMAGPVWVSGTQAPRAQAQVALAWRAVAWLELGARAAGVLPQAEVGGNALGARVWMARGSVDVRARLPWPSRDLTLCLFASAGPLWTRASGSAAPPRVNRSRATVTTALSLGAELAYFFQLRFGVLTQLEVATSVPDVQLQLGASQRRSISRLQVSLVLGPTLRF